MNRMMMNLKMSFVSFASVLLLCVLALSIPTPVQSRAILGVDMGSLYMKVALVQSGRPIEIVTNLHSKRKTEQMILFDNQCTIRSYGADAAALLQRKAHITPTAMSVMLGRNEHHPTVQVLAERHYPIVPKYNETRNGLTLQIDGISFTPEELVAMVLTHAVDISVAYAAEGGNTIVPPKDIVLTVPSYSTILERRALLDASTLVDLNVLMFIDENTAAALHYAMDKTFDIYPNNTQIILFYNLGASSLQISIIKFYNYLHSQKYGQPKSIPSLEVISKSWDVTCGGDAFDHIIVEYLADQFNIAYQKVYPNKVNYNVRNYTRPMTKLRIQANKIKHVLSANTDIPIYIDSVHDDVSLQTQLTRDQFESMVEPLIERVTNIPINKALQIANITIDQLTGIELLGGGMRIPRIQNEIQKLLPKQIELGYHINSDESFALGAAFAGANISTAFRVRQVGMVDINPFPIGITLTNLPNTNDTTTTMKAKEVENDNDTKDWTKTATIFKAFGKIGVKKTIAFTHTQNIHCGLDYINDTTESLLLPTGTELSLVRYNITGVPEFINDMEQQYNITNMKPKISLQFELSTSGLVSLIKAEAAYEETYTVQEEIEIDDDNKDGANTTNTTLNTTDSTNTTITESKENVTDDSENLNTTTGTSNDTSTNTTTNATATPPKRKMLVDKEKKRVHKKSLHVQTYYVGSVQPHSEELLLESQMKLYEMAKRDKDRMMLEEAKNKVESYIYKIKNKLSDDEEIMMKFATEKERTNVQELAEKAEDWLYEDGSSADLATMESKFEEISEPFEKILLRIKESEDRPKALEEINKKLTDVENLIVQWETTKPQITSEERESVIKLIDTVRKWIEEKEAVQAKAKENEDPTYLSTDIPKQFIPIETLVLKLSRKPKPKPPPKNETNSTNTNTTEFNATSTNETVVGNETTTATDTNTNTTDNEKANDTTQEEIPSKGGIDDEL